MIAAAGILLVAAITPGPNNFVALAAGARVGLFGALPVMAGIVLGTLALVTLVMFGAGAAFAAVPRLRLAIAAAGCAYLSWLGLRLMTGRIHSGIHPGRGGAFRASGLPDRAAGLFVFQFLNPKSWATVLTVTAALPAAAGTWRFWVLMALFVLIPAACLIAWTMFGSALTAPLGQPGGAALLQRVMGALLIVSAVLMWFSR